MKTIQKTAKILAALFVAVFAVTHAQSQNVIENLEIGSTEAVKVAGGTTIKNLTVRADRTSCGQLVIDAGVVNVERMTYKFSMPLADWTMIAFPSDIADLNAADATNFGALGMTQNTGNKRFLLKTYSTEQRAVNKEPWVQWSAPNVQAHKAYLMYITGFSAATDLEFYFSNLMLDKTKNPNTLLVDVSLVGRATQQSYPVKIKAANTRSNTLEVAVYNDAATVPAPLNYQNAVNAAKIYFTEDNGAFRISLPNSEPCKVLVLDKKMQKVLRALEYISPAAISTQGLKRGEYNVYVEYGGASDVKKIKIK